MTSDYLKLLQKINGRSFISDHFHARTNNLSLKTNDDPKKWPKSWTEVHFKTYPRFEKIILEKPELDELIQLVHSRRSSRVFKDKKLSFQDLSYILYSSCGLIHTDKDFNHSRRPYPSAGARYPLEVYPLALNVEGLKKGLYHYNVRDNNLELLSEQDITKWVSKTFGGQDWLLNTSVIFIITAVLNRVRVKYRDRGYRFALIEAGHMGQNICLAAEELKLGCCALGGYIDDKVDKLIDVGYTKESTIYALAVGTL